MRCCERCGTPLPANARRNKKWCSNNCSALASYYRRQAGLPPPAPWQHPALTSDDPELRAAAIRARELGQLHGWSGSTIRCAIDGLVAVLQNRPAGEEVPTSRLRRGMPRHSSVPRVAEVLDSLELLHDDTVPAIRLWIERSTAGLPSGFAKDVRAWLLTLLDGDERSKPRRRQSLYVYFNCVKPLIESWSVTRDHLREVTTADVAVVLRPLRGSQHSNAVAALRSLFGFAKRKGLTFTNPTVRLRAQRNASPLVPMTEEQIRAIEAAAASPAQRLVVALAAVHATRAAGIRDLTLEDLDLPNRRITIAGNGQRLGELVHQAMLTWLDHRRSRWPHTHNRHVLINDRTSLTDQPVSGGYLHQHLLPGLSVDQIRRDCILHEALSVGPDPLHLSLVFHISHTTASRYSTLAEQILGDPLDPSAQASG